MRETQAPRFPEPPPSAPSQTVSRDKPTQTGQVWVNYDAGRSEGRGGKGFYYTANYINGKKTGHDDVYRQNPLVVLGSYRFWGKAGCIAVTYAVQTVQGLRCRQNHNTFATCWNDTTGD